jgi:hypothetical protein
LARRIEALSARCRLAALCVSLVLNDAACEIEGGPTAYPVVNAQGYCGSTSRLNGAALYGSLATDTGGDLYLVSGLMRTEVQREQLRGQLRSLVRDAAALDCRVKVRASVGVRLVEYLGKGRVSADDVLELAGLGTRDGFSFTLAHEGARLGEEDPVHVQVACLFADRSGRRRVRVLNLTLLASLSAKTVFQHIDLDCLVAAFTKQTIGRAFKTPVKGFVLGPLSQLNERVFTMLCRYIHHPSYSRVKSLVN